MRFAPALAVLTGVLTGAALAQDLPDPGAPAGAEATLTRERGDDTYALPVGRYTPEGPEARRLTGRVIRRAFRLDAPEPTLAQVIAGYRERLGGRGFEEVFACMDDACGGFDFRFHIEVLPAPAMEVDGEALAQLSMHRPGNRPGDGQPEAWVSVLASRVLGRLHVQTVTVLPEAPEPADLTDSPEAPEAPAVLPGEGRQMAERLREAGRVRVEGLDFEVGGAAISESSRPMLETLATMLRQDEDLRVAIVGHTDNQGDLETNLALSRERARAVRRALIERGVPEAQVQAEGVGYLAPVATNATGEGRARNRRVELVLRETP